MVSSSSEEAFPEGQDGLARWHLASPLEAIELLEKLAAITPRPAINVVRYHRGRTPQALAGRPLRPRGP
jgi:hypothetical protein